MIKLRLKYVNHYIDCTGRPRFYFRKRGAPRKPLPGMPGSAAFMSAYTACLQDAEKAKNAPPRPKPGTIIPKSFADLTNRFQNSLRFKALRPITQQTYRNVIRRLEKKHKDKPVAQLDRQGIVKMLGEEKTLGGANQVLKIVRMLMRFAIDEGFRTDDPTYGLKKVKLNKGHPPWDEEHIAQFGLRHPLGSKAWDALTVVLCTAQRRSDIVRLGRQHIRGGKICFRQSKTGKELRIPIHPDLQAYIDTMPRDQLTFLVTEYGLPFSPAGFGNWFGDRCREAGLSLGFNGHGLRKACARRLAEAGCTVHEIMSITGHVTLQEVEVYTRAANEARLAENAMTRLTEVPNRPEVLCLTH